MLRRTRKLIKANIRQIDPLNCGSTIGYTIITGRRGVYADIDMTDCNRKINWSFAQRDGDGVLAKIDAAIEMFKEFRVEWERVARRVSRRPRKRRS